MPGRRKFLDEPRYLESATRATKSCAQIFTTKKANCFFGITAKVEAISKALPTITPSLFKEL